MKKNLCHTKAACACFMTSILLFGYAFSPLTSLEMNDNFAAAFGAEESAQSSQAAAPTEPAAQSNETPTSSSAQDNATSTQAPNASDAAPTTQDDTSNSPSSIEPLETEGDFSDTAQIVVSEIPDMMFTGKEITPAVVVRDNLNKAELVQNVDYDVIYINNINSGVATVTLVGKGSYIGQRSMQFTIVRASLEHAIVKVAPMVANGTVQKVNLIVVWQGITLPEKVDYDFQVEPAEVKEPGDYTITVTGIGNFTGSCKASFRMLPSEVTVAGSTSVKAYSSTIPAGSTMDASETLTPENKTKLQNEMRSVLSDTELANAKFVEVNLKDASDASLHTGFGTIQLAFPVDAQFNGRDFKIWHLHQDGTITTHTAKAADGYVMFSVTSLSSFAYALLPTETSTPAPSENTQTPAAQNPQDPAKQTTAGLTNTGDTLRDTLPKTSDNLKMGYMLIAAVLAMTAGFLLVGSSVAQFARKRLPKA